MSSFALLYNLGILQNITSIYIISLGQNNEVHKFFEFQKQAFVLHGFQNSYLHLTVPIQCLNTFPCEREVQNVGETEINAALYLIRKGCKLSHVAHFSAMIHVPHIMYDV